MRKLITIILVSVTIITGCSKNSNSTAGLYYMKATISATSFSAEGLSKVYQTSSSSSGLNLTYIFGKSSIGSAIKLILITNSGTALSTGTIPINSGGLAAAYYYPKGLDSAYIIGTAGSIVLTALVPNIQGTFNFTCADSTQVTNGSFSVLAQQ